MPRFYIGVYGTMNIPANSADPAGMAGDMYFNNFTNTFRGFSTQWMDLAGAAQVRTITGSTAVAAVDDGNIIICTSSTNITLSVPASLRVGFNCAIWQKGAGTINIVGSGGMVIKNRQNLFNTAGQDAGLTLNVVLPSEANIIGDLA